ncbi:MAG: DUF1566 domain-containing protein [Gammaproteobacteria bacterium]|nr:DUF1566 domain-containing protein [Gammaproteobacteria bacterium]
MKVILLIMTGLSLLNADFTKAENIVSDSVSMLEWQDDAIGTTTDWQGAIGRCEGLELGGHSDWRLPNINELNSIVDLSIVDPAIVSSFENTTSISGYWSSTTYKNSKDNAWFVHFYSGNVSKKSKANYYNVRCVRGGQ